MARLMLDNGTVFEGTDEEIKEMMLGAKFKEGDIVRAVEKSACNAIEPGEILKFTDFDGSDTDLPYRADKLDGSDYGWFSFDGLVAHKEPAVKPFKVGDYVKVLYTQGTSREVGEIVQLTVVDNHDVFPYECKDSAYRRDQIVHATDEEVAKAKGTPFKVGDYVKVVQKGHHNFGKIVKITSDNYSDYHPYDTELLNGDEGDCHNAGQLVKATAEEVAMAIGSFRVGDYVKTLTASKYGHVGAGKIAIVEEVDYPSETGHTVSVELLNDRKKQGLFKPTQLVPATYEEVAQAKNPSLKVGDYLRVSKVSNAMAGFKVGQIVKYVGPASGTYKTRVDNLSGSNRGYGDIDVHLVRATDEEVAQFEAQEHRESFEVGDYARVTKDNYEHKVGHIVKIIGYVGSGGSFDFHVDEITNGGKGYIASENIEKISAEKVAKLQAEQEEIARWEKIGRKPNEFKKGDIVRVSWVFDRGTVDEFDVVASGPVGTAGGGNYQLTSGEVTLGECIELISPVEARFDATN